MNDCRYEDAARALAEVSEHQSREDRPKPHHQWIPNSPKNGLKCVKKCPKPKSNDEKTSPQPQGTPKKKNGRPKTEFKPWPRASWRGASQVIEDAVDDLRFGDERDNPHRLAAARSSDAFRESKSQLAGIVKRVAAPQDSERFG